jgi:hypothetical protein
MKIYFKVLILFAVFFTFATFQACIEGNDCDESVYYCDIADFNVTTSWTNALDTVYYKELYLIFDAVTENCNNDCVIKTNIIPKTYAAFYWYYTNDSIVSIDIFAYTKFDTQHSNPININELFKISIYTFDNKNLNEINYPIKTDLKFDLILNEPDSLLVFNEMKLIYKEKSGNIIEKNIQGVCISPTAL